MLSQQLQIHFGDLVHKKESQNFLLAAPDFKVLIVSAVPVTELSEQWPHQDCSQTFWACINMQVGNINGLKKIP